MKKYYIIKNERGSYLGVKASIRYNENNERVWTYRKMFTSKIKDAQKYKTLEAAQSVKKHSKSKNLVILKIEEV